MSFSLGWNGVTERALATRSRVKWGKARGAIIGYTFVAPALAIFVVYYVYAIVRSLQLSVTDYKMLLPSSTFVGLQNYMVALGDHWVIEGFAKAAYFSILFYIGAFVFPLVVALAADRVGNPRVSAIYRIVLFAPAVVPAPLVYRLFRWMYLPSFGLVNYLLVDQLHLLTTRPLWLVSPQLALPSIAVMVWWGTMGLTTIFLLAGLDAIPRELYEAARLDGASEWRIVWHLTLPLLKNTIMVWTVLRISAFGVVEPMIAMWTRDTGGAPSSVWTWAYYAWFTAFKSGNLPLGYASAIGWLGAIVMVALALIMRRVFREQTID